MNAADWTRAAGLYLPLCAAALAWMISPSRERSGEEAQGRKFAACLLAVLWVAPALIALQSVNQAAGWWSFAAGSAATLRGMPLELFLGWVVLWGVVPPLASARPGVLWAAALVAFDCAAMPAMHLAVHLGRWWLAGEAVAAALVLLPALSLARWTATRTHLRGRATLQILTAGMVFLYGMPELIFAARPGSGWSVLLGMRSWERQLGLQAMLLLALPGVSAVAEFARRGGGTPIPYDPPQRLVTSGVYRYLANPMQSSCTLTMLAWAGLLRSGWMALAALGALVYSAGIAEWDEAHDLNQRFGAEWRAYRAAVRVWIPRWRPYHAGVPARLYIARTCGPCSALRKWIEARDPVGVAIIDAETLPAGSIRRMRYDPGDGSATVQGIRALARALEHLHLGWAFCGMALRLPGVSHALQILVDACGLGPREIPGGACETGVDIVQTGRTRG